LAAVKIGNNKIIYQDILTALADATNDLRNEQRPGATTDNHYWYNGVY